MDFTMMSGVDFTYTILFIMFVIIFTYPPAAVIASGLTIENLFSFLIDSELKGFMFFHIKRSTLTLILHSFLPLIYYLYICYASETIHFLIFKSFVWKAFFQFSILLPIFACTLALYWYQNNWNKHPIAESVYKGSGISNRDNWRNVVVNIDNEMKSIDKFVSGVVSFKKIIITNNWIVQTDLYTVRIVQQSRVLLSIEQCNVYSINANRNGDDDFVEDISNSSHIHGEVQYLKIAVKDIDKKSVHFHFSVNINEYDEIKSRINAPLKHAKGIIIHQTLGEKFAEAFKEEALKNDVPRNLGMPTNYLAEPCIGCSQTHANVKLVQMCSGHRTTSDNAASEVPCGTCYCRPMWCVSCLGKWFASRQLVAKKDPGIWMSQKSSCPTCRSIFCILDVVILPD